MPKTNEKRHEFKAVMPNMSVEQVYSILLSFGSGLRKTYPDRMIYNTYYDTIGLNCYHDHINGVHTRKKYRVRRYGTDSLRNYEIKVKSGSLGYKLQNDVKLQFSGLLPTLQNSYLRSYYETWQGEIRLTIDRELNFNSIVEHLCIVEFKFAPEFLPLFTSLLQTAPIRLEAFSKYIYGIEKYQMTVAGKCFANKGIDEWSL